MEITREDLKNNQSRNVVQYDTIQNTKDIARLKQDVISLISEQSIVIPDSLSDISVVKNINGNGSQTVWNIAHLLGFNIIVQVCNSSVIDSDYGKDVPVTVKRSASSVQITYAVAPLSTDYYKVLIQKIYEQPV